MLQAQVNYWTLVENARHNRKTESQTDTDLGIKMDTLVETRRHNVVGEQLGRDTLNENIRHNVQSERLGFANLAETTRHNKMTEDLGFGNLAETTRHNYASESVAQGNLDLGYATLSESTRTHFANEAIGRTQAAASATQANASMQQAAIAGERLGVERQNAATSAAAQELKSREYQTYVDTELPLKEREMSNKERQTDIDAIRAGGSFTKDITQSGNNIVRSILDIYKIVE